MKKTIFISLVALLIPAIGFASTCLLVEQLTMEQWEPDAGSVLPSSICIYPDGRSSITDAVLNGQAVSLGITFSLLYQPYGPSVGCEYLFLDAGLDFGHTGGNIKLCGGGDFFSPCESLPCGLGGHSIFGGGHSPVDSNGQPYGEVMVVWVPDDCGHSCSQKYIELYVNSPDINGDLVVNITDYGFFTTDLHGAYNYRSDFNFDGEVNVTDAGFMTNSMGSSCQ